MGMEIVFPAPAKTTAHGATVLLPHVRRKMSTRVLKTFGLAVSVLAFAGFAQAKVAVSTLSLEREAQPGEVYQGTMDLTNNGDGPQGVVIYQTDYLFYSDGSNVFGDPGTDGRSNARWVTFSPARAEIPPHQRIAVSYEVRVPEDSTLVGTYWSMIMVEEADLPDADSLFQLSPGQAGVRQVVRYGVQCITQIGGSGTVQVGFTGTQLVEAEDRSAELQVDVENTGERWLVPTVWAELYRDDGQRLGRFQSEKRRLFPNTSVRYRINLGDTPSGKYKALVVVDNDDQKVFGAKYDLEF